MFEIRSMNAERYRQETRRVAFFVMACFVVQGLLLSTLLVKGFGAEGGDNFYLNLTGVALGVLSTALLVRFQFWEKPWMAAAVYGWRLKRNLMRLTNVMHHIKAGIAADDVAAMSAMRFYHLGLIQMCQLDNNPTGMSHMVHDIDQHAERMTALGLDLEQNRFDENWLVQVRTFKTKA